jgi:H+-translocating NAD(P) transhydrogenase subunit alpha
VQRGMTVAHNGEKLWPPPPVQVSAAPAAATAPTIVKRQDTGPKTLPARVKYLVTTITLGALFLLAGFSPQGRGAHAGAINLIENFTVFALAIIIGYYVIGHVHHALHTPLLSVTNAISGIIVVGALLQIGHHDTTITVLSFVAIFIAGINIFGGFTVTRRMLRMFTRS